MLAGFECLNFASPRFLRDQRGAPSDWTQIQNVPLASSILGLASSLGVGVHRQAVRGMNSFRQISFGPALTLLSIRRESLLR
jgi:hypothetical protein